MKVIVTLADQWGGCEPGYGFKTPMWYRLYYRAGKDPEGTVSYRAYVAEIAARYRDDPAILAWQLINEGEVCAPDGREVLRAWAADVSGVIKANDPNHLVSIGTMGNGQSGADGYWYQYLHDIPTVDLCEYHDYGSPREQMPGDEGNGLQVRINQCNTLGKPIFVGEAGIGRSEVGTLDDRATAFNMKLFRQFAAGVDGFLAWDWWDGSVPVADGYEIGPGDPALNVLSRS